MSINLTDQLHAATAKGKLADASERFLEVDKETVQQIGDKTHQLENAIKDITATGGASTANAVSYSNSTSGMTAVTAQGAIDELAAKNKAQDAAIETKAEKTEVVAELDKKFNKENIAQKLGESNDKVVSQKKLYDLFSKKMNLLDLATQPGYLDKSGIVREDTNWCHSDYIPFGYKKNIASFLYANGGEASVLFYDINKTIIGSSGASDNIAQNLSIETPVNTAFIRISTISYEFKTKINTPTLYFGDSDLLLFSLECAKKQDIVVPTKTIKLLDQVDRICLYGDSISSSDYTWYKDAISKYTGIDKVYLSGFSGYTINKLAKDAQLQRIFDLLPDLIIIEVGGNDVGGTVGSFGLVTSQPLVEETNIKNDYDGTYFIQAIDHIIRKIKSKYSYLPYIAVLTPTAQKRDGGDNTWNLHRNWLNKRNAVAEACIKNSVHCIDMFNLWGVDMSKEPSWVSPTDTINSKGIYTMDGLHPNRIGFEKFAQIITSQIEVKNHKSKNFGNTLFTNTLSADGTNKDVSHRCCYMRPRPSYLIGIKFRIWTYSVNNCFCAFDKDKNIISKYTIKGNRNIGEYRNVVFGDDVAYYSVLTLSLKDFDKSELIEYYNRDIKDTLNNNSKGILWLGTSIPAGKALEKSYPMIVGEILDVNIINKSLGSSFMSTGCYSFNNPMSNLKNNNLDVGKCLSETVSEKEERFRPKVTDNTITEDDLNTIKSYSFENLVFPYLDSVDTVVIDHGYNDRYVIQNQLQNEGFDEIDWNSRDKSTFVGAMNYLIDKIHEKYPRMRIILSGHYQNVNECRYVCLMQKALAEHFGYPILDLWSYAGMSPEVYVKGTGNYFTEYNKTYGTKYSPVKGSDGNYSELIINCPDTVHPHSDVSGKTINKIGVILSKLIGGQINV